MALSGTYYGPWLGSGYQRVILVWSATQNVANNTSTITATLKWQNAAGVSLSSTISKNARIVIDGTTYSGTGTVGIAANTTKTIMTASKTITHNTDGTKSFTISGAFDIKFTLGGTYYSTTSASGSATLDTIPRASQPSLDDSTVYMRDQTVRIYTNRASSDFTHTLTYSFGSASGTIATGVGTYHDWVPPITLASEIPNATNGLGTITCKTYNGSTLIGTKTVSIRLYVPGDIEPSVSIGKSGVDIYQSQYVQGKSRVAVSLSASGTYGSTISSRSTTVKSGTNLISSSSSNSFTSGVINYSGTITIATTVTDSRGRTASSSTTISVVAYTGPQVTGFSAYRANADGNANAQGAYIRISGSGSIAPINNTNGKSATLRYRERGASTWIDAASNNTSYTPSLTATVAADVNKSYEAQIVVADYFTSSTQLSDIGTAFVLMDFHQSGNSMAIGKVAEGIELLEVGGNILLEGMISNLNIGRKTSTPALILQDASAWAALPLMKGIMINPNGTAGLPDNQYYYAVKIAMRDMSNGYGGVAINYSSGDFYTFIASSGSVLPLFTFIGPQ